MKNLPTKPGPPTPHAAPHQCGARVAHAAVRQILKAAYRRHTRGRVAQEAMVACLGR